jgi:hypothetical protein
MKFLPYTVDLSQYTKLINVELIAHIDRVDVYLKNKNKRLQMNALPLSKYKKTASHKA